MEKFEKELTELINSHSLENGSNIPDYLVACLKNLNARDARFDFELFGESKR